MRRLCPPSLLLDACADIKTYICIYKHGCTYAHIHAHVRVCVRMFHLEGGGGTVWLFGCFRFAPVLLLLRGQHRRCKKRTIERNPGVLSFCFRYPRALIFTAFRRGVPYCCSPPHFRRGVGFHSLWSASVLHMHGSTLFSLFRQNYMVQDLP